MVGLVLVSHSRPLAEALVALVRQVTQEDLAIAYAAGAGDDHTEFGTDAVEILEAIQSVYSPDGVLILMDLGSAVLSAELALEMLPEDMRPQVRFSAGPLIEGAIAAGVQASLGSDLATVQQEAQRALLPKADHLHQEVDYPAQAIQVDAAPLEGPTEDALITLENAHGLHARPAARFVQLASSFEAQITVQNVTTGKGPVSANSLNALATLGAVKDHTIEITASGPESRQAVEALSALVAERFGEPEEAPYEAPAMREAPAEVPAGALPGVPVSEGVALGPAYLFQPPPPPVPDEPAEDPQAEWERLQLALDMTRKAIHERRSEVLASLGETHASIFDAHLLILNDPDLLAEVRQLIESSRLNAAQAWNQGITRVADTYRALDDPYLQARAIDVEDVGHQVLGVLAGRDASQRLALPQPVILVAPELTPTQTAQLDMHQVLGLVTLTGGPTSHSAILARALGIPAVTGVDLAVTALPANTGLAVDGFQGLLYVNPPDDTRAELERQREAWLQERERLLRVSHLPAETLDGHTVEVAANAGNPQDAEAAVANGAQGIGLLRTEFLFLTRESPPTEEEQFAALEQIAAVMKGLPVIVRTLDVGGDKELPYIDLKPEANPFLGVRAIRLTLQNTELFRQQLRAILRAAAGHDVRIMFPMVTGLEEIQRARELLAASHEDLAAEGLPHRWPIETGIMVETPAAAILSPVLAAQVDFFSLGTNDLTQYTLAAERGNPHLSDYSDALNPAVLRLIESVVQAAHSHGRWVGVCGELAGDPAAAPILVGLGVDELSMNPAAIPRLKAVIRAMTHADAVALAGRALEADTVAGVRALADEFLESLSLEAP